MLRCADGKMLHMTHRFSLTITDEDYQLLRVAAFTHGTQPAVEARNLMLAQLRASGGTGTMTAEVSALGGPVISAGAPLAAGTWTETCSACGQPMLVSYAGAVHHCTAQTTATEDTTEENR
jgi:hypothetical protein